MLILPTPVTGSRTIRAGSRPGDASPPEVTSFDAVEISSRQGVAVPVEPGAHPTPASHPTCDAACWAERLGVSLQEGRELVDEVMAGANPEHVASLLRAHGLRHATRLWRETKAEPPEEQERRIALSRDLQSWTPYSNVFDYRGSWELLAELVEGDPAVGEDLEALVRAHGVDHSARLWKELKPESEAERDRRIALSRDLQSWTPYSNVFDYRGSWELLAELVEGDPAVGDDLEALVRAHGVQHAADLWQDVKALAPGEREPWIATSRKLQSWTPYSNVFDYRGGKTLWRGLVDEPQRAEQMQQLLRSCDISQLASLWEASSDLTAEQRAAFLETAASLEPKQALKTLPEKAWLLTRGAVGAYVFRQTALAGGEWDLELLTRQIREDWLLDNSHLETLEPRRQLELLTAVARHPETRSVSRDLVVELAARAAFQEGPLESAVALALGAPVATIEVTPDLVRVGDVDVAVEQG